MLDLANNARHHRSGHFLPPLAYGTSILKKTKPRLAPLLFAVFALLASATQAQNPQVLQQTRQLLDWLGFIQLLEQMPQALNVSIEAEAHFRNATPAQVEAWRRELEPRMKQQQMQQGLIYYVAERYRADTFQRVAQILQEPLTKRVRYFDLAMTQPGTAKSVSDLRAQMHTEPSPTRRGLVQEIDAVGGTSLLAAVMQTGISERVRRAAGDPASDDTVLQAEIEERQRFLAPLTADYSLYAYRYLRDEELASYRDLLKDAQLQWLLDISRQGLTAVLQGDVRPPDSKR
ncbi:MAG: hypothetical protein JWM78_3867 [Verrucomicrobiaceae bacterium]|nr:hypothetical protein [Verrucomicrobiaceae bacterium]